jgi:hypothetical protein
MRSEVLDLRSAAAAFLALALVMLIGIAIPRGQYVLVVGWPGTSQARMMQIVAAANGSFVEGAGHSWLAIAHADAPGLAARLMQEGAMIVLDHALAVGCTEGK